MAADAPVIIWNASVENVFLRTVDAAGVVMKMADEAPKLNLAVGGTVNAVEIAKLAVETNLEVAKGATVSNLNGSAKDAVRVISIENIY
ncbi:MAG: hypothetical protein EOM28_03335 [Clostridia bacterium]|nr:hypothetical protein [Clostridia bacterium]